MDYDHRHHVGNRADVWKHVAVLAVLAAHKHTAVTWVETHAGRGRYTPLPGGEWRGGVGALLDGPPLPGAADRYVARVRKGLPELPGSPLLAAGSLGRRDALVLYERDEATALALRATFAQDPRARVVVGDGWAVTAPPPGDRRTVVLVDPPYNSPEDWLAAPDLLARLHREDPGAALILWLPIKRWTRPGALRARLRAAGVPAVHCDLTWAKPERDDLAGSGLTLVGVPEHVVGDLLAAGVALGPRLSLDGTWSAGAEG